MHQPVHGVLLSTLVALANAQEPTQAERFAAVREKLVAETRQQLLADDLATVAWGGHTAAEYRLTECIPQLRARLAGLAKPTGNAAEFAALALLDALVETDAIVPGEELAPFLTGWCRDAALMLLGARPEANRALLLQQYRTTHPRSEARIACGCWLAGMHDPAFLDELLLAPVTIEVIVGGSGDDFVRGIELAGGFFSLSHYRPKIPPGFPQPRFRHLAADPAGDATTMDRVRLTRAKYIGGFCLPDHAFERRIRTARTAWLRQYLDGLGKPPAFDLTPILAVEWQGADALRDAITKVRRDVEADRRAVVEACVQAKLLDAPKAAALPPITWDVQLTDFRADQATPLPKSQEWSIRPW